MLIKPTDSYFAKYCKLFFATTLLVILIGSINIYNISKNYSQNIGEQVYNFKKTHSEYKNICEEIKCEFYYTINSKSFIYKNKLITNPINDTTKLYDNIYIYNSKNIFDVVIKIDDIYISYNLGEWILNIVITYAYSWIVLTMAVFFVFWRIYVKEQKQLEFIATETLNILSHKTTLVLTENLHHELKTPIEVITNKLLKLEGNNNDLKLIEISLKQVNAVIDRLKIFKHFKIEKNNEMDFYNIISVAKDTLAVTYGDINIKIDKKLKDYKPVKLSDGDIINILINHMKNSIEAVSTSISFELYKITKEHIHLIISDDGNGIEENVAENLFKPNFSSKSGLRGNGMYINKTILENSGGGIKLFKTSTTGNNRGTSLLLIIPYEFALTCKN